MFCRKLSFRFLLNFIIVLLCFNLMGDTFQYNFYSHSHSFNNKIAMESFFLNNSDKHILDQNKILDEEEKAFFDKLTISHALDDTLRIKLKNIFLAMILLRSINIPVRLFDFFRYMDSSFSSVFKCKKVFLLSGYNISDDLIIKKTRYVVISKNGYYCERDLLVDLSQRENIFYRESGPYKSINCSHEISYDENDKLNISQSPSIPIPKLSKNNFISEIDNEVNVRYESLDMAGFILDNFDNDIIAIVGRDYNDVINLSVVCGELDYIKNNLDVIRTIYFNLPEDLREQYIINVLNICKLNENVKNMLIKNFNKRSVQFMLCLCRTDELNSLHLNDNMILNLTEYDDITLERIMFFRKILSRLKIFYPDDYMDTLNNLICLLGDKFEWDDSFLKNLDIYYFACLIDKYGINFDECIKKDMELFCSFFIYGKYEKQKEFLNSMGNKKFFKDNFQYIMNKFKSDLCLRNDIERCLKVYCYTDDEMCDRMLEIILKLHEERLEEVLFIAHELRLKHKYDWFKLNYLENIINKYNNYYDNKFKFLGCMNKRVYLAVQYKCFIKIIEISDVYINSWDEDNTVLYKGNFFENLVRRVVLHIKVSDIKTAIIQFFSNKSCIDEIMENKIECMA
jgi:hypothetical protein